jgi:hypothetical protein
MHQGVSGIPFRLFAPTVASAATAHPAAATHRHPGQPLRTSQSPQNFPHSPPSSGRLRRGGEAGRRTSPAAGPLPQPPRSRGAPKCLTHRLQAVPGEQRSPGLAAAPSAAGGLVWTQLTPRDPAAHGATAYGLALTHHWLVGGGCGGARLTCGGTGGSCRAKLRAVCT